MALFQLEDLISQTYLPLSVHHNRDAGRMARSHRPVLHCAMASNHQQRSSKTPAMA